MLLGPVPRLPLRRKLAVACAQASRRGCRASLAPRRSPVCGHPLLPHPVRLLLLHLRCRSANRLIPSTWRPCSRRSTPPGAAARQAGENRPGGVHRGRHPPPPWEADQLARLLERVGTAFALAPGTGVHRGGCLLTPSPGKSSGHPGRGRQPDLREPQTMSDPVLAAIGRSHRAADTRRAHALAREVGAWPINMDLIALPAEGHPRASARPWRR